MPAPVPTQASVRVVKSFTYRGATKLWSNRYFLNSSTGPTSTADWNSLNDAIVAAEKAIYPSWMTIVECINYEGGSSLPVNSKTYTQAGTGTFANAVATPGDVAAVIRYSTTQRTSKNHPIYLFNYYHAAMGDSTTNADVLNPAQKTALDTYGQSWVTGFTVSSVTYKKTGPFGAVAQSRTTLPFLRHRDFKK